MPEKKRCGWVRDEYDRHYHDTEWGVPEHDDRKLFEFLILEGMQAGLTWNLILKRREAMREAFDGFDYEVIAGYGEEKKAELMQNQGIIRNRRKIDALVTNAAAFMAVQREFGSFDAYLWNWVDGKPIKGGWKAEAEMPATSPLSDALSRDLKKRGFKFVGSTICYSYLQAAGLLNDHVEGCAFAG
ncbi:DNA-3-methyladenine glycosylase I [Ruminococcaceae bacterium OttesenSCG-928-D13]|nr:DNA-3-methyladenine glycosylase I [Ruminococcaceae bacterium OttesenSCG-928-D13]